MILILSIPVSHPLSRLPASSNLTHVYNILVSYLFLTQVLYLHSGFLQLLGQCIGTWCAVKFCRSTQKSKMWTFTIFWANMALLTVNHFIRWYTNLSLDIVEITGPQMVLVMKLGLFAWAAYDGGRPAEKLDAAQLKERLVEVPGLLPFLGYWYVFRHKAEKKPSQPPRTASTFRLSRSDQASHTLRTQPTQTEVSSMRAAATSKLARYQQAEPEGASSARLLPLSTWQFMRSTAGSSATNA